MNRSINFTRAFYAALFVAMAGSASGVLADERVNAGIVNVPNSPIVITACKLGRNGGAVAGPVVIGNRTKHSLVQVQIVYAFYDNENTRMYQETSQMSFREPVLSGETYSAQQGDIYFRGPSQLLTRVTCRVQSADFSANKHWQYGQRWNEKIVPIVTEETASLQSDVDEHASSSVASANSRGSSQKVGKAVSPPVTITSTNGWNDTVDGNLLVHVALDVQGGTTDSTITPANLLLTMALANGGKKQYAALPVSAPTFQKMNPLGNTTTTAYEVDPKEDLGRLGSVIVPAHGSVKIVATFLVGSDVVANASDNRQVGLK